MFVAINADHLTFLENYVAERLRETPPGAAVLASRLRLDQVGQKPR